jgi:hypothetical protein
LLPHQHKKTQGYLHCRPRYRRNPTARPLPRDVVAKCSTCALATEYTEYTEYTECTGCTTCIECSVYPVFPVLSVSIISSLGSLCRSGVGCFVHTSTMYQVQPTPEGLAKDNKRSSSHIKIDVKSGESKSEISVKDSEGDGGSKGGTEDGTIGGDSPDLASATRPLQRALALRRRMRAQKITGMSFGPHIRE